MLRKVGLASALLLALPAFAHAWTVTAKIGSGQGTVVSGTKTIAKPVAAPATSYVGYYKADNATAQQVFTVDPAAGYSISSVIVNGVKANGVATAATDDDAFEFTVAAGSPIKNSQSLVVYFTADLLTASATQPANGGKVTIQRCDATGANTYGSLSLGSIAGLKSGSYVKVTAMPNSDYKVKSVAGDTAKTGLAGDVVSKVVQVNASGAFTAEFELVSSVKGGIKIDKNLVNPLVVVGLDATSTVANGTVAKYTFSATPATGAIFNPRVTSTNPLTYAPYVPDATGRATVMFSAEGTYTVSVVAEMADGTQSEPVSTVVNVRTGNACMTCHNNRNPELMAKVQSGKHNVTILTGHSSSSCQRCHSTEGYNAYSATAGADFGANPQTAFTAVADKDANANIVLNNVACFACHNNHDSVLRTPPAQWDPKLEAGKTASNQFKLCTSCHNLVNASGTPIASGLSVSGTTTVAKQQHAKDWYRNIASTHYDLPSTGVGLTTTYIEGYNIRYNKQSACTDCHGHDFNAETGDAEVESATVYTQWAKSGHAGKLLVAKFAAYTTAGTGYTKRQKNPASAAAIMAAGVTAESGPAWEHYNWDEAARKDCQKCHTSTGVSNFLDAVATYLKGGSDGVQYDSTKNDFSHLVGWNTTTKTSRQNEMLYCWGCHNNAGTGELRVNGKMVLDYKAAVTDTKNIEIVAPGKSAACLSCHSGRGNVVSLFGTSTTEPALALGWTKAATEVKALRTSSATSTHYLNAGATIFKNETKVGYEYAGQNYANAVYYAHKNIGCNDCHMANKNHEFEVVKKDAAGAITALVGTNCVACHDGEHGAALTTTDLTNGFGTFTPAGAAAFLEEEAEGYHQALQALDAALKAKGYVWTPNHPYFMLDVNADGAITAADKRAKFTNPTTKEVIYAAVPTTSIAPLTVAAGWTDVDKNGVINDLDVANVAPLWPTQGDLGAAHNYNYLHHEPGAYAHNSKYAKRLIFDSIDWLDNGVLNGSITIDPALTHAAAWLGAARP